MKAVYLVLFIAYMLSGASESTTSTENSKLEVVSHEVNMVKVFGKDIDVDERGRISLSGLNGSYGCSFLRQQGYVIKTYLTSYETNKEYLLVYNMLSKQLRCYEVAE